MQKSNISSFGFIQKSSKLISSDLHKLFFIISVFFSMLSLILIRNLEDSILSFLINIIIAYSYKLKFTKDIPGYLLIAFSTLIYFQIPTIYILWTAENYNFDSHSLMPKSSLHYNKYIFYALFFFYISYFSMLIGLGLGKKIKLKKISFFSGYFNKSTTKYFIVLIGLFVLGIIFKDNSEIIFARSSSAIKEENIFALIFNDIMFMILFVVLFYKLRNDSQTLKLFLFFVVGFFVLNLIAGKKSALLSIVTIFFLLPVSLFNSRAIKIWWPTKKTITLMLLLSPLTFLYGLIARTQMNLDFNSFNFQSFLDAASFIDFNKLMNLIVSRFSVSINNYIVIFETFFNFENFEYRLSFLKYTYKGFLNLILPGTPYPESYVPTSQLFSKIISMLPIESNLDKASLLRQANTQPFSLFGALTILLGPLSILFSFILGFLFSCFYKIINSDVVNAFMMIIIYAALQLYSIEGQLQFSIFILISSFIVYQLISIINKIKL